MPLELYNLLKTNGFINNPLFHFPITNYSTIPVFQHSNWGEAPKFELKGRRG